MRERGHKTFPYIDHSFIVGDTNEKCARTVMELSMELEKLGFVVHPDKSVFELGKKLTFLGFILDSKDFSIRKKTAKIV